MLDSARPKWSDVELLASLTTRRPSDQSSSWASVFTANVAGVQGTVMVKTYPGKRRDALAVGLGFHYVTTSILSCYSNE